MSVMNNDYIYVLFQLSVIFLLKEGRWSAMQYQYLKEMLTKYISLKMEKIES